MTTNVAQDPRPQVECAPTVPGMAAILRRMLWIVPVVAVICLALFLSIGRTRLSETGVELVVMFVYSALIGPPSAILLTWIGYTLSERLPRAVFLVDTLALLGVATVGVMAGALLLQWLRVIPPHFFWQEFRGSWPFAVVITLVVGLSISSFETMRYKLQEARLEAQTRQVERERAYKLLAEARLSSLESRIQPHFLFNTLNSIAALIPSDPGRAEDTVAKLASLLRFSLNANQSGLVPLAQELKVTRDYLEIEATRFGPRLRYDIDIPAAMGAARVPPLALQTLVENAVKHVAARRPEGVTIEVRGALQNGLVRIEVADDGPGFSLDAITPDHGLGNLIARLDLLFGARGRLDVAREGGRTLVRLSFPAET